MCLSMLIDDREDSGPKLPTVAADWHYTPLTIKILIRGKELFQPPMRWLYDHSENHP